MITINTPIQTPEIILSSKSVNNFSSAQDKTILLLKKGIWIYFFLIIFEGALRKWIIPGLASPLLIVRDPIAFWLLFTAWNRGILPSTPYLPLIFGIGIISIPNRGSIARIEAAPIATIWRLPALHASLFPLLKEKPCQMH